MSITINTVPEKIDNSASFNVTTSLVEDADHVNLRTRANLYHEGAIKATVEKPKGLSDFDFYDILKSLVPGLLAINQREVDIGGGSMAYQGGTIDSTNLITSWTTHQGTWTTLNTTGSHITSAICTVFSEIRSNNITFEAGAYYVFVNGSFSSSGTTPIVTLNSGILAAREEIQDGKNVVLMSPGGGTFTVVIGGSTSENFSGDFYCYKITTDRDTFGNLLASYFIDFIEVYEDADGETQTADSDVTALHRFVPATETSFSDYVLVDSDSLFANKTFRNNVTKFYSSSPLEHNIVFFTEYAFLNLYYSKDGAAYSLMYAQVFEGFGIIPLSIDELLDSVSDNLRIYLTVDVGGSPVTVSEVITIYVDNTDIDERVVLEYDGTAGGKEYLAFEGLTDITFATTRKYITGANKNRKPLSMSGVNRQSLETRFNDINNTEYLKGLLMSEVVKKLNPDEADPTDVTIITDGASIDKGRELFTNRIDIEYEY